MTTKRLLASDHEDTPYEADTDELHDEEDEERVKEPKIRWNVTRRSKRRRTAVISPRHPAIPYNLTRCISSSDFDSLSDGNPVLYNDSDIMKLSKDLRRLEEWTTFVAIAG